MIHNMYIYVQYLQRESNSVGGPPETIQYVYANIYDRRGVDNFRLFSM